MQFVETGNGAYRAMSLKLNLSRLRLAAVGVTVLTLLGCADSPRGGAEQLFADAWRYDSAGAGAAATRTYGDLAALHPDSPLAPIARERLAALSGQLDGAGSGAARAFEKQDFVCTLPGLYGRDARWCGIVREVAANDLLLEVKSLRLNSFWAWGLARSTCTGNRYIGYLSYGDQVWVPRRCLVPR
jgi:hypothetical protein